MSTRAGMFPATSRCYRTTEPSTYAEVFGPLSALVSPRPVAWVSTLHPAGGRNLAPFSFYTVVSTLPPMISITVEDRENGAAKDTLTNIELTGEFVVNSLSSQDAEAAHLTSTDLPPATDEFSHYDIDSIPSRHVAPPRVGSAAASMECRLEAVLRPGSDSLVIGRVLAIHVAHNMLDERSNVVLHRLDAAARIGSQFAALTDFRSFLPGPDPRSTK